METSARIQHYRTHLPQSHSNGLYKEPGVSAARQNARPPRIPSRSIASQIRQRWNSFSRRKRIILITTMILLVLTVILGIALGATVGKRTDSPAAIGAVHTGQLTYFTPAVGACGFTNTEADMVAAISHELWDKVQVGANPNTNPLCGKRLRLTGPLGTVDVTVADRCPDSTCTLWNVDASKGAYLKIAQEKDGRVPLTWQWLDIVPAVVA